MTKRYDVIRRWNVSVGACEGCGEGDVVLTHELARKGDTTSLVCATCASNVTTCNAMALDDKGMHDDITRRLPALIASMLDEANALRDTWRTSSGYVVPDGFYDVIADVARRVLSIVADNDDASLVETGAWAKGDEAYDAYDVRRARNMTTCATSHDDDDDDDTCGLCGLDVTTCGCDASRNDAQGAS